MKIKKNTLPIPLCGNIEIRDGKGKRKSVTVKMCIQTLIARDMYKIGRASDSIHIVDNNRWGITQTS